MGSILARIPSAGSGLVALVGLGLTSVATAGPLPDWQRPDAYSVDMEMSSDGETFTMQQTVDHDRTRTHLVMDGDEMILLDLPDDGGTTYTIMPSEKMAMKQTAADRAAMGVKAEKTDAAPAPDAKIEPLGPDKVDGVDAQKYRISSPEGEVLAWFDAKTSAPVRMESNADGKKGVIRWKNWKTGPQKADLFAVPKDYEIQDMGEISRMMQSMGGMPGGMPGMSMPGGAMGGLGGQMGSQFGAGVGSQLGAAFGGPLGAAAGHYIGGKVGGMIGRKAAGAVTPGR